MSDEGAFTNMIGMKFVKVEPGTFAMGNDTPLPDDLVRLPNRARGDFDERPVHRVSISRSFHFGAAPVTNAQYEQYDPIHGAVRGKLGYSNDDDEAVVFVSWNDAVGFCEWLTEREGRPYRLPTEAEWEYACRAGTIGRYYWGKDEDETQIGDYAWYSDNSSSVLEAAAAKHPNPVGQKLPNAWGLHDMLGNVWEWCVDRYGGYTRVAQTDPLGPYSGREQVIRGGCWSNIPILLRCAKRSKCNPENRQNTIGLRPARTIF